MDDRLNTTDFTIKRNKYLDSATIRKEALVRSINKSIKYHLFNKA